MKHFEYREPEIRVVEEKKFAGDPDMFEIMTRVKKMNIGMKDFCDWSGVHPQNVKNWMEKPVKSLEMRRRLIAAVEALENDPETAAAIAAGSE